MTVGLVPSAGLAPSSGTGGGGGGGVIPSEKGRNKIFVAADGFSVTVTRRHPSGRTVIVRNMDHAPLSGGTFLGYDYEAPIGIPVTYVATTYLAPDTFLSQSDPVTVTWTTESEWLKDPLDPIRNIQVRVNEMSQYDYATPTAVHEVLGRPDPVTVGEVRQAATGTLSLLTLDKLARDQLHYITASGHVLLFQSTQQSGVGSMYLAPLSLAEQRAIYLRDNDERLWALNYQEVGPPVGDAVAFTNWQDVLNTYDTWQEIVDQNTSWLEMIEKLGSTAVPVTLTWRGA